MDSICLSYTCGGIILGMGIGFMLPNIRIVRSIATLITRSSPKMVLVVRNDLGMGKGKIASQCAHAAIQCYKNGLQSHKSIVDAWILSGQRKVVLKVDSETELASLHNKTKALGLINSVICDAGKTQLEPGTCTVLGIGPAAAEDIDSITSYLKLL